MKTIFTQCALLIFVFILIANSSLAKGAGGGGGHGGGHSGGHGGGHGIGGHASFGARGISMGVASRGGTFGTHTYGPRGGIHKNVVTNNQKRESNYYYYHYPYRNNNVSDTAHRRGGHLYLGSYFPYYDPYYYQPYFGMAYSFPYSWNYVNDPEHYNAISNATEGYVVYNNDTIEGEISFDDNVVLVKRPTDAGTKHSFHSGLSSKKLKCVVAYNDDRELLMVRTDTSYNKLWRVVHQGKLTLYDDHYDFIYAPEDVSRSGLLVFYKGKRMPLGAFNDRERLIELVNQAYGVQLTKKDYNWDKLLAYIDTLD